jgi:hypothetical protein
MYQNGWPVRVLVGALLCASWAAAPGCGGGNDDDPAFVNPGPEPDAGPDPDPEPAPVPPGWSVQAYGAFQLTTVSAVNANRAWTTASTIPDLAYTVDGGATWATVDNP